MTVVILFSAYFLVNFFKQSSNIVIPMFSQMFGFSNSVQGFLTAIYFLPYALVQLSAGALCRRFSSTKVAGCSLLIASLGAACLSYAGGLSSVGDVSSVGTAWIVLGRFLTGLGTGSIFISVINFENINYSGRKYAVMVGVGFMASSLGTVCSVVPLKLLLDRFGIRYAFMIITVVVASLGLVLVSLKKQGTVDSVGSIVVELKNASKEIASSRILIWGTIIWAAYVSIQNSYSGMWCTTWASYAFPDMLKYAGVFGTLYALSVMTGCLLAEVCHRKTTSYLQYNIRISYLFAFTFSAVVIAHFISVFGFAVLAVALFGFSTGIISVVPMAVCKEVATEQNCSSISGIWNFAASILVLVVQWTSGVLIDLLEYNRALTVFAVLYLLCTVVFSVRCGKKNLKV